MSEPTPWERVVEATKAHEIERVSVTLEPDSAHSWTYVICSCGEEFRERWEFTDHIRRLAFEAALARR